MMGYNGVWIGFIGLGKIEPMPPRGVSYCVCQIKKT